MRLLGPLEVVDEQGQVPLGGPKERRLLAALAIHMGNVVPESRLIDVLWGDTPPRTATKTLQNYVLRLRRALHRDRSGGESGLTIVTVGGGYALHGPPDALDSVRVAAAIDAAREASERGDHRQAADLLESALAQWRGPSLVEFAHESFAMAEAARLDELKQVAIEELIDAQLALGRHSACVAELEAILAENPLRERRWAQLMLALYRSGRQAHALRAYQRARSTLVDEIGAEPGPALRRLEQAIIEQDPSLETISTADVATSGPTTPARPPARAAVPTTSLRTPLPPSLAAADAFPFVGRVPELELVREEWEQSLADGPRLVLLAGEPGVGKTRLAGEVARRAYATGARVLFGGCDEEPAAPYQPFAEALADLFRHSPDEALRTRLGPFLPELVRLLPEIGARFGDLPPPTRSDPETERFRLFDAVARSLVAIADQTPLVLVMDDLQWAARPTLLLLRHVVSWPEPAPLFVVGTFRSVHLRADHPILGLLGDLHRRTTFRRIDLGGLDESDVATFLERATGRRLDEQGRALCRAIHADTGGNPFFVGEVVRHLRDSDQLLQDDGRWFDYDPARLSIPAVRDVVRERLSRLADVTRLVLVHAAVVGSEFDLTTVQRAGSLDEESLVTAVEEALDAGLLVETDENPVRYRFSHALVRAALYDGLSVVRRALLHRHVGEAIEEGRARHLDRHLPELAHHFSKAAAVGGAAKAVMYSTRAGDTALAQLAHDQAASHYRQALDLLEAAGVEESSPQQCDLLLALGEAQRRAGSPDHRRTLLEAAALAEKLGDAERQAQAALANSRGLWSATFSIDSERVAVLQSVLGAVGPSDSPMRARLLSTLANELVYAGDYARTRQRSDEALAMARRLGDLPTLASVLSSRYMTICGDPGTLGERLANADELAAVAEQLPDPALRCMTWGWRAVAAMEAGNSQEAERCFEVCDRMAHDLRQPTISWYVRFTRASLALFAGRFAEALRLSAEAFGLGEAAGHPDARLFASAQRLQACLELGRTADLEPVVDRLRKEHPESSIVRSWRALLDCEADRVEDARRLLIEAAERGFVDFHFQPTWLYIVANWATVCAHVDDRERAATLYELMCPYPQQVVTLPTLVYAGAVSHYLGALATTLGRHSRAEEHFRSAAAVHEAMGAPAWLARTRLAWGRLLLTSGDAEDRDRGAGLLTEAIAAARELGLVTVERRARTLLEERAA